MKMPSVSVIVPNYNYEKFLSQRIDSIINQNFKDIELIILDDASSDQSEKLIESYRTHEKVSHIIINDLNSGSPFIQWKKGIELAKGKYIWICEADDWAHQNFLSEAVNVMDKDECLGLFFSESYVVDEKGCVQSVWKERYSETDKRKFSKSFKMNGQEFITNFLVHKNFIPNASGVLIRKEQIFRAGGIDDDIKNCSDWLLWIKILLQSDVYYCDKILNYFRRHQGSVIGSIKADVIDEYVSWLDPVMRKRLNNYMIEGEHRLIRKANDMYLHKDVGLEGLWFVERKKYVKGIPMVLQAYCSSTFQPFFIKSLVKQLLTNI